MICLILVWYERVRFNASVTPHKMHQLALFSVIRLKHSY